MTPGVVLFTAASGDTSARCDGGIALFSAYDPRREAERFAADALRGRRFSAVVILGAGLGHLEGAAQAVAAGAKIVPVYYDAGLAPADAYRGDASWHPECGESIELFIERALREIDPREVAVLDWPAAARAFPALAHAAHAAVLRVLKENAYGGLTVAASGRRWLRNALANFLFLDSPVAGMTLDPSRPLVIAAAGPSLNEALPLLSRRRERFTLWAPASSLMALRRRGLEPDLVVSSDPGYYASRLLAGGGGRIPLLAMPLSASRAAWRAADRVFLFAQPNFFELELFARSRTPVPAVDAHGTVSGTALLLARTLGAKTVFFCGLDCCYDDIRSHASPHPHEDPAVRAASRVAPAYGAAFDRALALAPRKISGRFRSSESLAVYAGSFREPCRGEDLRVFRLFPSPVDVPGMEPADEAGFEGALRGAAPRSARPPEPGPLENYPDRAARKRIVRGLLDDWLSGIEAGSPAPELVRFFAPAAASGGEREALAVTAGFLKSLCARFTGGGRHA